MKYILLLSSMITFSISAQAQNNCFDYSIQYNLDSMEFRTADFFDYGDSMIVFSMTNIHPTQGFAYPMSKLVPVTPLPPGMSMSDWPWIVFGSSWNAGFTYNTKEYFFVDEPIPVNYSVTFEVWAKNLEPLLSNTDSCLFDETFTINLNPFATPVKEIKDRSIEIYPQPATDELIIKYPSCNGEIKFLITDIAGNQIMSDDFENVPTQKIDISNLAEGIYLITISGNGEPAFFSGKFIKIK